MRTSRLVWRGISPTYSPAAGMWRTGLWGAASDTAIWAFSKANGFSILSKDSDFSELSAIEGAPPKVIWLRVGNVRPVEIEMLIRNRTCEIGEFLADPERPCLVIARKLPRCEQKP